MADEPVPPEDQPVENDSCSKNGDGTTLASGHHRNGTIYQAKLVSVQQSDYLDEDVYFLHFQLSFMNPFAEWARIQGATFTIHVKPTEISTNTSVRGPHIRKVVPTAQLAHVSDQEVTTGQKVTIGGSADVQPGGVNVNFENSSARKTSFKGIRIIHGLVKNKGTAIWTLREESSSKSGLPQYATLRAVVSCGGPFRVSADLSVKMQRLRFGWVSTVAAKESKKHTFVADWREISNEVKAKEQRRAEIFSRKTRKDFKRAKLFMDELEDVLRKHKISETDADTMVKRGAELQSKLENWQKILGACHVWEDAWPALPKISFNTLQREKEEELYRLAHRYRGPGSLEGTEKTQEQLEYTIRLKKLELRDMILSQELARLGGAQDEQVAQGKHVDVRNLVVNEKLTERVGANLKAEVKSAITDSLRYEVLCDDSELSYLPERIDGGRHFEKSRCHLCTGEHMRIKPLRKNPAPVAPSEVGFFGVRETLTDATLENFKTLGPGYKEINLA